jgi:type III secretory pathway component EscR
MDVVEVVTKSAMGLRSIPPDYFLLTIPVILGLFAAMFVKRPGYHAFLAVTVLFWQLYYAVTIFTDIV